MDNYKVYVHINKINGKLYFGQTGQEDVKDRWDSGHGYKSCVAFNRAIEKYGWSNFEHIVLFENLSLEMANIIEAELIKKYKTTNNKYGYNITSGGWNYKMSESTKEKLRQAHLGKHNSEESKEKLRETWEIKGHPRQGKLLSEETKRKIGKANKGRIKTEEEIEKSRVARLGKKGVSHTEETKQYLSELAKERYSTPQDNPFYGKTHSEESRRKMSESHKKIPKEKHGRYGKPMSPKAREAIKQSRIKEVVQLDKEEKNIIACYESTVEAARVLGCSSSAISKCCTGVNRTCMGYVFRYKEEVMEKSG